MRIHQLDPLLVNQIAAGEVIERPASVLKELMENSLDAGAQHISVNLLNGGLDCIQVIDDGQGIHPEDLPLALSQHATSKIDTLEDLTHIASLGFRGEALASVSAISRFSLTSREVSQALASQVTVEGREQTLTQQVAAHPIGTTITIKDLFFNTPVRRKFLKSARTEFLHLDAVFKVMALSHCNVSFSLKHNQRQSFHLPKASTPLQQDNRIAKLCGKPFIDNSVRFDMENHGVIVQGWLGLPSYTKNQTDLQYCFLNGRFIRDKLISHAIKQAYSALLPPGRQPCFVLNLTVDPEQFDVNVHPTKREVRFQDPRWIHDFLVKALGQVLETGGEGVEQTPAPMTSPMISPSSPLQGMQFQRPMMPLEKQTPLIDNRFLVQTTAEHLVLVDMKALYHAWLTAQCDTLTVESKALLIPETFSGASVTPQTLAFLTQHGFDIDFIDENTVILRKIPAAFSAVKIKLLLHQLLSDTTALTLSQLTQAAIQAMDADKIIAQRETLFAFLQALPETAQADYRRELDANALRKAFFSHHQMFSSV